MGKRTTWAGIEKALYKYAEESELLEDKHGYKTPPVKTVNVKVSKKTAALIDVLMRT